MYDPGCRLERINASTAQKITVDHLDYLSNSIDCAAELIAVFSEAKRAKEKNSNDSHFHHFDISTFLLYQPKFYPIPLGSSIYRLHHNLSISSECKRNCQHDIHFDFNDATNKLLTPPHHVKVLNILVSDDMLVMVFIISLL